MRVTVLGGTIFVGRAVVEALVDAGHDVTVVHRGEHEPGAGYPEVEHLHVDRADLPPIDADAVVDCYAATKADAERVLARVPRGIRLVMLSSVDVYPCLEALMGGTVACDVPIDEDTPVRTTRYPYRGEIPGMDDYEKLDCEPLWLDRGAVVLRLPFCVGPHDYQRREEFVLRRVRAGDARMEIGAANLVVSRLLVRDIGAAVVAALTKGVEREIFVLADKPSATVRQLCEEIVSAAGSSMELVTIDDESRLPEDLLLTKTHQQHLLVSPAKAMSVLDWRPTPWRDAVRESVAWHLAHPPGG